MTEPKLPPEIARKLAEMNKAAGKTPPAKAAPAAPRAAVPSAPRTAPPVRASGGMAGKLAAVGWGVAALAIAAAVGEYYWFQGDKEKALAAQAAAYEATLQQAQAEADATLRKVQADASASQEIMKAELDYEKQPPLPLKFAFRRNGVLYVESDSENEFSCRVRLTRPGTSASKEYPFSLSPRAFRDLGAIEDWVFAKGDEVEFFKPGHKPWKGTFP